MIRFRNILLLLLTCTAAAFGGRSIWDARSHSPHPANTPRALVFVEDDLRIGVVPNGEIVDRPLRLKNAGDESVRLSHFEISCSCLGISPDRNLVLAPGESLSLTIRLKADANNSTIDFESGLSASSTSLTAVYSVGDSRLRKVSATLRYDIRTEALFAPPSMQLGRVSHRSTIGASTTVRLFPPVRSIRFLAHPEWRTRLESAGVDRWTLFVEAVRPTGPRAIDDAIEYVVRTDDGRDRTSRTISVRGEVVADLHAVPDSILFGRSVPGRIREESFRIESRTGRPFSILRWDCDASKGTVTPDDDDKTAFLVSVVSKSSAAGEHLVRVVVGDDNGLEHAIAIPVRYLASEAAK